MREEYSQVFYVLYTDCFVSLYGTKIMCSNSVYFISSLLIGVCLRLPYQHPALGRMKTLPILYTDLSAKAYGRMDVGGMAWTSLGRPMDAFFPNVSSRLIAQWFVVTHYTTQIVTSHRAFRERLYRLGQAEHPRCNCPLGGTETSEHVLY